MIFKFLRRKDSESYSCVEVDGKDMPGLYAAAWEAVDPDVKRRAVAVLDGYMTAGDRHAIIEAYKEHGPCEWVGHPPFTVVRDGIPISFHFTAGMGVRNALRSSGLRDKLLPAFDAYYGAGTNVRNWDDYYVQAIEATCGLRS